MWTGVLFYCFIFLQERIEKPSIYLSPNEFFLFSLQIIHLKDIDSKCLIFVGLFILRFFPSVFFTCFLLNTSANHVS